MASEIYKGVRHPVFITGGKGYIGSRLIKKLLEKDYRVIALVRKGSEHKLPGGTEVVVGNPFDAKTFAEHIPEGAVFIQLLGVPHPSPKKAKLFKEVDLKSIKASADAAGYADVSHFIYVSVAMSPSGFMKAYQDVRREGEEYCLNKNLNCTFIRPWYVLGPGHWWPVLLLPLYGIAELIPSLRQKARTKAFVTINQMLRTLVNTVDEKPVAHSIIEIKDIRKA
jgi:nucleoside-diphosphate-sugar epimerase